MSDAGAKTDNMEQSIDLVAELYRSAVDFGFDIAFFLIIFFVVYLLKGKIAALLDAFRVEKVEISAEGVVFERQLADAYVTQGLGPPSDNDLRRIRSIWQHLAPVVAGRRILWVDDAPKNNLRERGAFTALRIDVQGCRTTEEAIEGLSSKNHGDFDLVISDWTREPAATDQPEGLRLLTLMRDKGIEVPVIMYHGLLKDAADYADRRQSAKRLGAVDTTASPGDLLQWAAIELARAALADDESDLLVGERLNRRPV